jgi:hypothetical protein
MSGFSGYTVFCRLSGRSLSKKAAVSATDTEKGMNNNRHRRKPYTYFLGWIRNKNASTAL